MSRIIKDTGHYLETDALANTNGNDNFMALVDFSLGRLTRRELMATLSIDSDETLFLLMCRAGLPFPRLADSARKCMVEDMKAAFRREQGRLQSEQSDRQAPEAAHGNGDGQPDPGGQSEPKDPGTNR